VGARERTVRGRGGSERHGVDEIGCGELRREPHKRARKGGRPPDMGGDGLGSEGGGGRAERLRGMRAEEVMTGKRPPNTRED